MPSVRRTKTASGAIAVQVVRYENRKVVVLKHIGSGHTPQEVAALCESASAWAAQEALQPALFTTPPHRTLPLQTARFDGVRHTLAHTALREVAERMGFAALHSPLLLDLAIMRLIEPTSKLRTITLMERYFGIKYSERTVYRTLPLLQEKKEGAENLVVAWAKEHYAADLSLVLYDVTTLYFETFAADALRVPGFSKDSKSQQPQIVVGLLVTREGFPLGYEVFKGNTFEGHTMLPVLEAFAIRHQVALPIVVADAAMISRATVTQLNTRKQSYIVGARLGSASASVIETAHAALGQTDGATTRIKTDQGDLIVSFSAKRYRKDTYEMDKHVAKATALVEKGEPGRRAKFVRRENGKDSYTLNVVLMEKTTQLLGLKGYCTNVPAETLSNDEVIARYHDLWQVEAAFRMAKSDLETRPIFHHKEEAVRAHMVICFVALAIGKCLEHTTESSLRTVVDAVWHVTDARITDTVTGEVFTLRSEVSAEVQEMLQRLARAGTSY